MSDWKAKAEEECARLGLTGDALRVRKNRQLFRGLHLLERHHSAMQEAWQAKTNDEIDRIINELVMEEFDILKEDK